MSKHVEFHSVTVKYGDDIALDDLSFYIDRNTIFGVVGPANAGKTSMLKCINRTIDFISSAKVGGKVTIDGEDVRKMKNVYALRRRIGMVFPLPVGLPLSVYDNVTYGPRRGGIHDKDQLDEIVETSLKQAVLWDEVKDRLDSLGTKLSGGQQQRLTLARALSLKPEILCLDEFSIAIDPVTTMKIEDILVQLKGQMTIILVTNLIQQAHRIADDLMFLNDAEIVEVGPTSQLFEQPEHEITAKYLTGKWVKPLEMTETDSNSATPASDSELSIRTRDLSLWYGDFQALFDVSVDIEPGIITSLIGPSGCGKTTLLRCFNRINERYGNVTTKGEIKVLNKNIYDSDVSLSELRKAVGMVFQRPNPLPISIYENIIFGLRSHTPSRQLKKSDLDDHVESALSQVHLWDATKDRLRDRATGLTLEQQQKLCIARLLPLKPRVILMDEPCSALDADGVERVEELIKELRNRFTIVMVTHNMGQAKRASDKCIFMYLGKIVEHSKTEDLFFNPKEEQTAMYVEGRYG